MESSTEPVRTTAAPRAAWLARAVLLLAAAAAVVAGFGLSRPRQAAPFACPMHAEVRAAAPGACPVCGMALERAPEAAGGAKSGTQAGAPSLLEAAPGRELAVTAGELVTARTRVFSREVRAPARVDASGKEIVALLHADDLGPARTEEGGVFTPAQGASGPVPLATVDEAVDAPPIPADDATSWARFRLAAGAPPLAANTVGWVSWPARPRATLALPETAIVRDAGGPYVLVAAEHAPLGIEKRAVRIGKAFQNLGVVVSGLAPGERVVSDGAFTWDAERRLHARPTAPAP